MLTLCTKYLNLIKKQKIPILFCLIAIILFSTSIFFFLKYRKSQELVSNLNNIASASKKELSNLKNQDQLKINEQLKIDIKRTHNTYNQAIKPYEEIQDLKAQKQDVADLEKTYAGILQYLSDLNYSSGSALLTQLNSDINKKYAAIAATQISAVP